MFIVAIISGFLLVLLVAALLSNLSQIGPFVSVNLCYPWLPVACLSKFWPSLASWHYKSFSHFWLAGAHSSCLVDSS